MLTDRELSATAVQEEMCELGQELSKARRFGIMNKDPKTGTSPAERIAGELGDLLGSIEFYLEEHPEVKIWMDLMESRMSNKKAKLQHYNDPRNWGVHYEPV